MSFNVITSLDMAVIDRNTEYIGIPRRILMENAGRSVAEVIVNEFKNVKKVLVIAGLGDNGGDGLVCARYLHSKGFDVKVILLGRVDDIRSDIARENAYVLKYIGVNIFEITSPLELLRYDELFTTWCDVIVDAIIGTGIKGYLREPQYTAIKLINNSGKPVIAIDVPSGLDPDTGKVSDIAVKATLTVTLHKVKKGLITNEAKEYVGKLVVVDIGIPKEVEHVIGPGDLLYVRYGRKLESKKGDHGRIVIIGGSDDFTGAPTLAALTAYRLGVDLVIILSPESAAHDIRSISPNLIVKPLPGRYLSPDHVDIVLRYCEKAHAILIGPGITTEEQVIEATCKVIEKMNQLNKVIVIDADGIKAISIKERFDLLNRNIVLTPHLGEFKILTGIDLTQIKNIWERAIKAKEIVNSKLNNAVCVIKGNVDIITDGIRYKLNFTGNPGMTVGGTGDILSGAITALCTKVNDIYEAACIGTFITGLVGDLVVKKFGYHITPTDLINEIPEMFKKLMNIDYIIEKSIHIPSLRLLKSIFT